MHPIPIETYAYSLEDIMIWRLLRDKGIQNPTYLEIGTNHPNSKNNTYLFYKYGATGVLIEPLPMWHEKIQKIRPKDKLIKGGIGYNADTIGIIKKKGKYGGSSYLTDIRWKDYPNCHTIQLYNINDIIKENFNPYPSFISIDCEGNDLRILQTLNHQNYPIPIICAETNKNIDITGYLKTKGYTKRYWSEQNTIYTL
jgi:FkbM family methyltransferase